VSGNTMTFTPQQLSAIESRGGALLVSAAAGSGKTKVLVERLLSYVTDKNTQCDINEFLVITYTRAAASELRGKILEEISARLSQEPENRHLRRQSLLCYSAHISTIHGFCADILRENAHLLDITPDFRVGDESETAIIKAKVLEDVLNERYETIEISPGFALLVDTMSAGRDDHRLVEIVLDAHAKLQSHPYPEQWADEQIKQLDLSTVADVSETVWGRYVMEEASRAAKYWNAAIRKLLEVSETYSDFKKAYGPSMEATADSIEAFIKALDISWDEARKCSVIDFPRAKNIKGYEEFKEIRTRCRDAMKKAASAFDCASSEHIEDMEAMRPAVSELLRLVLDFDAAYAKEKKRRGIVDFSDQEHLAVRLLIDEETGGPTELARELSGRFKEIMVDEYQDVNRVQELLFRAVSRNEKNIFMVGDVKQSIYRFRLADPSIFLSKYYSFKDDADALEGEPRRILLSTNFRSRKGILDAVNFIFRNIMSADFGEMDYTAREFLNHGRAVPDIDEPAVELDILDMSAIEQEEDEESPEKTKTESFFTAKRIAELIKNALPVPDGEGGVRPVKASDIVILLRSMKDKAWQYAEALKELGIPVSMPGGEGFFETMEIAVMTSLLSVIDNPLQDIPLISVLRSPVYGFTPDELAVIRTADRTSDFYTALEITAEKDAKCRAFLDELKAFRSVSPDMPADKLIWHIYSKTGMLGVMGALNGGEARRNNLMLLFEYARRFEANGYKGLFGFMTYLRRLMERGGETVEQPETAGEAVRIMSIHKSKGLEFPVVFLADTAKKLNNKDAAQPLLVHSRLGIGAKRTDMRRRIEYPTLARIAVAKKLTAEMMAEELRVLYVAMTRAREKLIIVSTFADADKELSKLTKDASSPVPPVVLENTRSMAGWILLAALTRPEAKPLRTGETPASIDCGEPWVIRKVSAQAAPEFNKNKVPELRERPAPDHETVDVIRKNLSFVYPYTEAPHLPSKLTATELKGRFADYEAAEEAEKPAYSDRQRMLFTRPDFIVEKTELTGAERGTALHLSMQYIDYEKCASVDSIREELNRLCEKRFITEKQKEAVSPHKIYSFFSSPLGKRVLAANKLHREFKFSLLVKAAEYYPGVAEADDEILFQGVIDCCFEEAGALTVIDFKTDHVTKASLEETKKLYAPQLKAYGQAMERIFKRPVKSLMLYFFAVEEAVEI
jgi:ATP-dependent helicase/nuclease subunit A